MSKTVFQKPVWLALVLLAAASAQAQDRQSLPSRAPDSAKAHRTGFLPATKRLEISIDLPLRDKDAAARLLHQIYEQHNAQFRHYLTPEEFASRFSPLDQDYQKVIAYAKGHGLNVVHTFANRSVVDLSGNVSDIEAMFHIRLATYQHPTENREFYAPDAEPSLDAGLPVLDVAGLDNFVSHHRNGRRVQHDKRRSPSQNGGSDPSTGLYMGSDFRNAYVPGTHLDGSGQVVGLFEYQGYTAGDVTDYENHIGYSHVLVTNVLDNFSITLGTNSGNDEVASDIELTIAMAPGLSQVSVYEGNSDSSILSAMAEPTQPGAPHPNILSSSWGFDGDAGVEGNLIQLGLQGQSFMYAIGDNGAYANGALTGTEQDYLYLTAVGGTKLFMNGAGASWSNEVVWNDGGTPANTAYFATAGGVLSAVPMPDYQQTVSMALNSGSSTARDLPDIALVARDILIYYTITPQNAPQTNGQTSGWLGTSAAAPLFAGVIALADQEAANQGQPPVGFLNPALYQIGGSASYLDCFHDITSGNNAWANSKAKTSSNGLYPAAPGYDLCTGWGTCAGQPLLDALTAYAGPTFVNFGYSGTQTGSYANPFNTMQGGIDNVQTGGTIIIEALGYTPETPTITKPMTIIANDGPVTIGN